MRYNFNSVIIKEKFKYHTDISKDLLQLINKATNKKIINKNQYYNDSLKTDWLIADDFNRDWVKNYKNYFFKQFEDFSNSLGYQGFNLTRIWYQQYEHKQTHGWHIHSGNYTGAYYLKLPKDAPSTEFLYPDNLEKSFTIDVQEGDIIFFPAYFIHRSPESKSKSVKTIISWNINFENILEFYIHNRDKIDVYG